jgi:thymidylate synthase (FAD)
VNRTASAEVVLVAWTQFAPPADADLITANGTRWQTDADGGQALAEFAGRACYQAWNKPNPSTATNAGYLRHILEVGHLSVIEHANATFYITGVSRSLTHELIRHRHFSFSQLSQRYVPAGDAAMVEPDVIAADPELHRIFAAATDASVTAYRELLDGLEARLASGGASSPTAGALAAGPTTTPAGSATVRRKQARQAARSVLPNATETRIVVTGNYRAWRHFVTVRATEPADVEIRELAVACLRQLQHIAPNVFGDFVISTLADGTEVAASPYATEG